MIGDKTKEFLARGGRISAEYEKLEKWLCGIDKILDREYLPDILTLRLDNCPYTIHPMPCDRDLVMRIREWVTDRLQALEDEVGAYVSNLNE